MIFSYVDLADVQALRLASSLWSQLGISHFFKPFVLRPDRKDLERLNIVTRNAAFSTGIESIRFETGTLNLHRISMNMANHYAAEFKSTLVSDEDDKLSLAVSEYAF